MDILGVGIDRVTFAEARATVRQWLTGRRARLVVTPNPEMLVAATRDASLRTILRAADLVVADGAGVVLASRWLKQPLPERVPGVDLALAAVEDAAAASVPVYLLGAAPGVAERAAARLQARFPGLKVAGTHHGYFKEEEEPAVVRAVREAGPGLLLVGLGSPRQERWLFAHYRAVGARVSIGVGGSLDVYAGLAPRAPAWMQRHGLEWLYRLLRQPSRAGRMLNLPRFLWLVLHQER